MLYDESIKVYQGNLVTETYAREEGRREVRTNAARGLKDFGYSTERIADCLGITPEEIEEL